MADPILAPPRRDEFLTPDGKPTHRFIKWTESLTRVTNTTSGEVSEVSELISGASLADELVGELEIDMDLITPHIDMGVEVISTGTDFTTTGDQVIICTNTLAVTITLNPTPDDGESVHIKRQNTGTVTVSGSVDGGTTLAIGGRYSAPHLIFTLAAGEWSII